MGKHSKGESTDVGSFSGKLSEESIAVDAVKQEWRKIPEEHRIAMVKDFLKQNNLWNPGK